MACPARYIERMGYDDEDDDFDYDEFIESEFGSPPRARSVRYRWQLVAMGLVALFALSYLSGLWSTF